MSPIATGRRALTAGLFATAAILLYYAVNPAYAWYAWNLRDLVLRLLAAWRDPALALAGAAFVGFVSIAGGFALAPVRRLAREDPALALAIAFLCGAATLGLATWVVAATIRVTPVEISVVAVAIAGPGIALSRLAAFRALRAAARRLAASIRRPGRTVPLLVVLFAAVHLAVSLAPERGEDSLWGHLPYAARVARGGNPGDSTFFTQVPGKPNLMYYPNLIHGIQAAAMAPFGAAGARSIAWLFLAAALVLVARLASEVAASCPGIEFDVERAGALAALLLVSAIQVGIYTAKAYLDVPHLAFASLAVYGAYRWARTGEGPAAVLALLGGGFAAGTRHHGLAVLGLTAAAIAAGVIRRPSRRAIAWFAAGLALASIWALPWYVSNWVRKGNPFYPFFGGSETANLAVEKIGHAPGAFDLALAPLLVTYREGDYMVPAGLGIHVAFLPASLAFLRGRRAWTLFGAAALYFVAWYFTTQNGRYLMPLLGPLSALSGCGLAWLIAGPRAPRALGALALSLSLAVNGAVLATTSYPWDHRGLFPCASVLAGTEPREEWLLRHHAPYRAIAYLNRVPEEAPVVLLESGTNVHLYLDLERLRLETWAPRTHDPAAYMDRLSRTGVTHVFVMEERIPPGDRWRVERWGDRVFAANGYSVFRVRR